MELGLRGAAVMVTGAASGIGLACARAFAAESARVGLIDRSPDALAAAEREVASLAPAAGSTSAGSTPADAAPAVASVLADVTNEDALAMAIDTLAARLGGVDVLVCCAGISGPFGKPVDEISAAEFQATLAVNVTGPFLAVKHALAHLRRAAHPAVVLMGSDSGFVAAPGMVPYNASKGAVVQLTRALATDLAADGVRVTCVCPSIVDTPMSRGDLTAAGELGPAGFAGVGYPVQTADEVARHVLYLASPASRPVNGTTLVSDFGYLARSSFPA